MEYSSKFMVILPGSLIRSASNLWLVWFSVSYDLAAQELGHQGSHQRAGCSSALQSFATYFQVCNLHHQNELEKEVQAHTVNEPISLEDGAERPFMLSVGSVHPLVGWEVEVRVWICRLTFRKAHSDGSLQITGTSFCRSRIFFSQHCEN